MKTRIKIMSILSIFLVLTISCSEDTIEEQNMTNFEKLDFKENPIEVEFASYDKVWKLLNESSNNYFNNNLTYDNIKEPIMIKIIKSDNSIEIQDIDKNDITSGFRQKSDPVGIFDEPAWQCKTCISQPCIENTIAKAIGDATRESAMTVTPNFLLGERVSVTVCYGSIKGLINSL